MKPIRGGPPNRGPFQGPVILFTAAVLDLAFSAGREYDRHTIPWQPPRQEASSSQPLTMMLPQVPPVERAGTQSQAHITAGRHEDAASVNPLLFAPSGAAAPFTPYNDDRVVVYGVRRDEARGVSLTLLAPPGPTVFGQELGRPARLSTALKADVSSDPLVLVAPPGPVIFARDVDKPIRATPAAKPEVAADPLTLVAPPGPTVFGQELARPNLVTPALKPEATSDPLVLVAPPGPTIFGAELGSTQRQPPRKDDPLAVNAALTLVAPTAPPFGSTELDRSRLLTRPPGEPTSTALALLLTPLAAPPFVPVDFGARSASVRPSLDAYQLTLALALPPVSAPFTTSEVAGRPSGRVVRGDDPTGLTFELRTFQMPVFPVDTDRPARPVVRRDPDGLGFSILLNVVVPSAPPFIAVEYSPPRISLRERFDEPPNLTITTLAIVPTTPIVPIEYPARALRSIAVHEDPLVNVLINTLAPLPPPPISVDQPSGGWKREPFETAYERQVLKRKIEREREKLDQAEALRNARDDDIQAELARRLHARLAEQAERNELARLSELVREYRDTRELPQRVQSAFDKALSAQTFSRLQALQREFMRMQEEEEMALLMILAMDD